MSRRYLSFCQLLIKKLHAQLILKMEISYWSLRLAKKLNCLSLPVLFQSIVLILPVYGSKWQFNIKHVSKSSTANWQATLHSQYLSQTDQLWLADSDRGLN